MCVMVSVGRGQPPPAKDPPKVLLANPLGLAPGTTTKVTLRGLKLDVATELQFPDSKLTAKILSKGKTAVPAMQDAKRVGDTQIEAQITVPADYTGATAALVVVTPGGASAPHALVVDKTATIAEKKPNNSFRNAQPVQVPQNIDGLVERGQVPSVFRFEGKAGQILVIEVHAARHGSALDSVLTLHNDIGQIVGSNDDFGDSTDSRLEVTLAKNGTYFLSLIDAHDQGGPTHVFRITVRAATVIRERPRKGAP
jgi:hypothetical protein